jgi:L-gulonolactone oxidase
MSVGTMVRAHATWSRHITQSPAARADPASEAEIAELIRHAAAARRHVKVFGGGHSFSDIGLTDGVLVSLDRMRAVVDVDTAGRRVTAQAGIRLHELVDALASRGLALPILGSVMQQSIAGAISTGTHGSSLRHGNLASLVCGLRIVTGRGEVLDLVEGDDRLAGARVGLGALGVITQVTLRCAPLFALTEDARRAPIEEVVRDLVSIANSAEYVKIWWLPTLPFANVYRYSRTAEPPTTSHLRRWMDETIVNRYLFAALLGVSRRWPSLTAAINRAVGATYLRESRRVGRYDQVLTVAMPPVHREMEYALALDRAPESLDRIRALIRDRRLRVNFVMEIRFVKGDDAWLSPAYGRDSCQIGAYIAEGADRASYFAGVEDIMQAAGARPHWGKEHNVTPELVNAMFPTIERFRALRDELDPDRVFENPCLARALG